MAEFDPDRVSTRSVVWNETDRSVHYGGEFAGVLKLNPDGKYDCVVQLEDKKQEFDTIEVVEDAAHSVAHAYWTSRDPGQQFSPTPRARKDGRACPRFTVQAPVRTTFGPEEASGRTLDLSVTGAALDIDLDINIDDDLELEIEDVIVIAARVVRKDGSRLGVEFINCGRPERRQIDTYLSVGRKVISFEMFDTRTGKRIVPPKDVPDRIVEAAAELRRWMKDNNLETFNGLRLSGSSLDVR